MGIGKGFDKSVVIVKGDKNSNKSTVTFQMQDNTIQSLLNEIVEADDIHYANFEKIVENAVIYYLDSDRWQKMKHVFKNKLIEWED